MNLTAGRTACVSFHKIKIFGLFPIFYVKIAIIYDALFVLCIKTMPKLWNAVFNEIKANYMKLKPPAYTLIRKQVATEIRERY